MRLPQGSVWGPMVLLMATVTVLGPSVLTISVTSPSNGRWPPLWVVIRIPFTHCCKEGGKKEGGGERRGGRGGGEGGGGKEEEEGGGKKEEEERGKENKEEEERSGFGFKLVVKK